MLLLVLACAEPLEGVDLTVSVLVDARNAEVPLDIVVADDEHVLARAPWHGEPVTLQVPPPARHDADAYVGVVDAAGTWRGVDFTWLRSCTRFCEVEAPDQEDSWGPWYGWNTIEDVWEQGAIWTGDRPSQGFTLELGAYFHGDEALTFEVRGGVDVSGLRRAVLVRDTATLGRTALSEAPPDATSITVGPGAPPAAWIRPRLSSWEGTAWYVDAAVAQAVAYDDRDGSGDWSAGDRIVAQACGYDAYYDTIPLSVAWVAPVQRGGEAWDLSRLTGYATGWTLARSTNGELAVRDEDLADVRWCPWDG